MPETTVTFFLHIPSYHEGASSTLECTEQLPGPPDPASTGPSSLAFSSNPFENIQGEFTFDPDPITAISFDRSVSPARFTCNVTVTMTSGGSGRAKMGWDTFPVAVDLTYPIP
jgi:hypothetical protein